MPQPVLSEEEQAAQQARQKFLEQQALMFMNNLRTLKVQLFLADSAGEIPDGLKKHLYGELIQMAGLMEVKDV